MSDVEKKFPVAQDEAESDVMARIERACHEMQIELSVDEMNFVFQKLSEHSIEEAREILLELVEYHSDDNSLDYDYYLRLKTLSEGPDANPDLSLEDYEFDVRFQVVICGDWSPYAEVRASTSMLDNPDEPAETIRMYIIGVVYANVGCIVATFFGNRFPSIKINFLAMQLIMYPSGRLLEYILPHWSFSLFGTKWDLNPGPWSFKEQMLSTQMMSSVDGPPFSFTYLTIQRSNYFFNESWAGSWGYMILLSLVASFTGYGIAGLLRGLLVYPVKCVWYGVLPLLSMNRTLTKPSTKENIHGWTIKRFPFLLIATLLSFCWYWFPELVFTALNYFSWITWTAPNNIRLAAVTGVYSGLGLNPISTFDWSVISGTGMVTPWYSTYVAYIGQFVGFLAIAGIYFSKSYYTQYLAVNLAGVYDNTGTRYNVTRVLTKDGLLDRDGYNDYSPAFLSAGGLVANAASFALFPASIVYALLYNRSQMYHSFKSMYASIRRGSNQARRMHADPFTRNLEIFPEVPEYWFIITLVLSLTFYIIMVEVYRDSQTPVWSVFFAIVVNIFFIVPFGMLLANTNTFVEVGLLIQVFLGYMIPHNANAMMITQCIANNFWEQAQNYISNQKQTHYARISSRSLFRCQYIGTFSTVFTSIAVLNWQFIGVPNYCDPHQPQKFSCASNRSKFASFVLWGTLGPKIYLEGLYPHLRWAFLIGVFIPLPFYVLDKWKPNIFRRMHPLLLITGASMWAPANLYYTTGNLYVGFFFNYYIRKHYLSWWRKYNYILYAGLGTGVAWAALIMFFATGYKHIVEINWWGNWVHMGGPDATGADYNGIPLEPLPAKGYFGPDPGHYPQP